MIARVTHACEFRTMSREGVARLSRLGEAKKKGEPARSLPFIPARIPALASQFLGDSQPGLVNSWAGYPLVAPECMTRPGECACALPPPRRKRRLRSCRP